mmetsp:Transcript_10488/g.15358  ORF Transcript_10488/g.15358 Transcript_10488/m.15358 type:complete len:298 (+) Transcript_10488:997-1890(+)
MSLKIKSRNMKKKTEEMEQTSSQNMLRGNTLSKQLEVSNQTINELKTQVMDNLSLIESLMDERDELKNKLNKSEVTKEECQALLESHTKELVMLSEDNESMEKKLTTLMKEDLINADQLSKYELKIAQLQEENEEMICLEKAKQSVCLLLQECNNAKEIAIARLEPLQEELESALKGKTKAEAELDAKMKELWELLEQKNQKIQYLQTEIDRVQSDKDGFYLKRKVKSYQEKLKACEDNLDKSVKETLNQMTQREVECKAYEHEIRKLTAKISEQETALQSYEENGLCGMSFNTSVY